MKKISAILACAAVSAMLVCACGSSDAGNSNGTDSAASAGSTDNSGAEASQDTAADTTAEQNTGDAPAVTVDAPSGYYYTLKGVAVSANAPMEPIVAAVGEPTSYFESESCAFQGLDKVYTYGSVVISTYPEDGVDYVYTIVLKDDTVETEEGICIGSTKDEVVAAYGDATSENEAALSYQKDDSILAFIFDGDSVASITYTAITE